MSSQGVKFTDLETLDSNSLSLSAILPVVQNNKNFVTTVSSIASDAGGTTQGTDNNNLNIRAADEGVVAGLNRGESSVDLQTSRDSNTQVASGVNSVIAGGENNHIIGYANAIPGGANNSIQANKSLAAGSNASALHDGSFVFSDSTTTNTFSSVQANSINFRAQGGLRLVDGNESIGKILTCTDTEGTGHWAAPAEVVDYDHTLLESTSGTWDSTYTTVSSNSATWVVDTDTIYDDSLLQAASGSWDSTYTTVSSNSASWIGGGNDSDTTIQNLSALGSHTAPNPRVIDLTQGLNVEGWLTANVSLQLSGAEAGQSGLITLGTGKAHDGASFTVDFYPNNIVNFAHTEGGHSVLAGDLADFATALDVAEWNYGSVGWYYTGTEYLLYVSEVQVYGESIEP